MRSGTPILEDLQKAAAKYQLAMEASVQAGEQFIDCLGKVGVPRVFQTVDSGNWRNQ